MTLFFILLQCLSLVTAKTVHLYVSPTGSDSNSGLDIGHPLQSLQQAVARMQQHGIRDNTVFVELLSGYHLLTSTLHVTRTHNAPVTFRAYNGSEVYMVGGRRIQSSSFHKISDPAVLGVIPRSARNKILQVHLPSVGVTDYGKMTQFGMYVTKTSWLELFVNGRAARLAQYPNQGYIDITKVGNPHGTSFTHASTEDARWGREKEPWALGYWYFSWSDDAVKIQNINSTSHQITLATKTRYGLKTGHYNSPDRSTTHSQGGYFRVFNMLSELDQPGEYYLDRSTGVLYVWPETRDGTLRPTDVIFVSMVDNCIEVDDGMGNINFEGFTLEACRRAGIEIKHGHDISIQNMEIRNTGAYGIMCGSDCRSVSVVNSDIHDTCGGISMSGGVRKSLIPSGNVIADNHIWKFSRVGAVGYNAISVKGVGTQMRYNHIHDGQYTGIRWSGNDHVMEYNHVHHMCVNTSDCGALHAGRDWTMRGNVIRSNYIHDTLRHVPGANVRGVMLDDEYSSVTIENNVFYNNDIHVNIGGGRDNIIRFNIFYNATYAAVRVDGRGLNKGTGGPLTNKLNAMPYKSSLWASKYPKLANISKPREPAGNEVYSNIFYSGLNSVSVYYTSSGLQRDSFFRVQDNHKSSSTTDFWSPDHSDFRLRCTAAEWANGMNFPQPVNVQYVGPRHKTGPPYKHIAPPSGTTKSSTSSRPPACAGTVAPATRVPRTPYFSDGSGPNTLYPNIPKQGCWLIFSGGCPHHPQSGIHRDVYGEQHSRAGTVEQNCLNRAAEQWRQCGSPSTHTVKAVFGPTGAMTMAGPHCYFVDYGCLHPGRVIPGGIHVDRYGELHGALTDENRCLSRAASEFEYCGSDINHPVSSVYGPTGTIRHAGAGCWIKIPSCLSDPKLKGFFYDAWGATNLDTDHDRSECLNRATYFWQHCGSHHGSTVTAYFRPLAISRTVS